MALAGNRPFRLSSAHAESRQRVPARLPGRLQPRGRGRERPRRLDRRKPRESGDERLHLREGPPLPGAPVRPGSAAFPGDPNRPKGRGPVPGRHLGRSARIGLVANARNPGRVRRRGDSSLLLRRIERPADPGHHGRPALPAARGVPPRPHGLRCPLGCRRDGPLRQDGGRRDRRLRAREPDRPVGGESLDVGHPPRPVHLRSAEEGGEARRDRPPIDFAFGARGPSSPAPPGDRPSGRARDREMALCVGEGRREVPSRAHDRLGSAARRGRTVDPRAGRGSRRDPGARPRGIRAVVRGQLPRGDPLRVGARAEPQRGLRDRGRARAAGRRGKIRGPGRGLHDEQLRRLEARLARRRARARGPDAARQHEPAGIGPPRLRFAAGEMPVRLQLQRARDDPASAESARGPRAGGSFHRRVRFRDDRYGAVCRRRASRDGVSGAPRVVARLRGLQPVRVGAGRRSRRGIPAKSGSLRRALPPNGRRPPGRAGKGRRPRHGDPRSASQRAGIPRGDRPGRLRGPRVRPLADPVRRRVPEHARPERPTSSRKSSTAKPGPASTRTERTPAPANSRSRSSPPPPTRRSARRSESWTILRRRSRSTPTTLAPAD